MARRRCCLMVHVHAAIFYLAVAVLFVLSSNVLVRVHAEAVVDLGRHIITDGIGSNGNGNGNEPVDGDRILGTSIRGGGDNIFSIYRSGAKRKRGANRKKCERKCRKKCSQKRRRGRKVRKCRRKCKSSCSRRRKQTKKEKNNNKSVDFPSPKNYPSSSNDCEDLCFNPQTYCLYSGLTDGQCNSVMVTQCNKCQSTRGGNLPYYPTNHRPNWCNECCYNPDAYCLGQGWNGLQCNDQRDYCGCYQPKPPLICNCIDFCLEYRFTCQTFYPEYAWYCYQWERACNCPIPSPSPSSQPSSLPSWSPTNSPSARLSGSPTSIPSTAPVVCRNETDGGRFLRRGNDRKLQEDEVPVCNACSDITTCQTEDVPFGAICCIPLQSEDPSEPLTLVELCVPTDRVDEALALNGQCGPCPDGCPSGSDIIECTSEVNGQEGILMCVEGAFTRTAANTICVPLGLIDEALDAGATCGDCGDLCPTERPSSMPSLSQQPSDVPSDLPSHAPSDAPSLQPSASPSSIPSSMPSAFPSLLPSAIPSNMPSITPSSLPSSNPSDSPSSMPSSVPSNEPSQGPSESPSSIPSEAPSLAPSTLPSSSPSNGPSQDPSTVPSDSPSGSPSLDPNSQPSSGPSMSPRPSEDSEKPSARPSLSFMPSSDPSVQPSNEPSMIPSSSPSLSPSSLPSTLPSGAPSSNPSMSPTSQPSNAPSKRPSLEPSSSPSMEPSSVPSAMPSDSPSSMPTLAPSSMPTRLPSSSPSSHPSSSPSLQPSNSPSILPSPIPSKAPSPFPTPAPFVPAATIPPTDIFCVPTPSTCCKDEDCTVPAGAICVGGTCQCDVCEREINFDGEIVCHLECDCLEDCDTSTGECLNNPEGNCDKCEGDDTCDDGESCDGDYW